MDNVREKVDLIKKFMVLDTIKELKRVDKKKYDEFFEKTFEEFFKEYPTLFMLVLDGKDTKFLDIMLNSIDEITKGGDKFEIEKKMGERLANEYLPVELLKK